jgi:hypothetical protein
VRPVHTNWLVRASGAKGALEWLSSSSPVEAHTSDPRTFGKIEEAQRALEVFVDQYNHDRTSPVTGDAHPQARFHFKTNTRIGRPPADDVAPVVARPPREVKRLVFENGLISVARQEFSVDRRLSGQHVAVRIEGKVMHVFTTASSSSPNRDNQPRTPR